jgi:hypothetical protein
MKFTHEQSDISLESIFGNVYSSKSNKKCKSLNYNILVKHNPNDDVK